MGIIQIDKSNIDAEHICCAIGNDRKNKAGALTKKDWMKSQFDSGLIFKRLDERGKAFIEYMPVEKAWKPVVGKKYMMINCLWVSGRFKGKGYSTQLLNECISDSRKCKLDGIVVVSSNEVRPFLTDKKFYIKHGFEVIDTARPYFELLALKFNAKASNPGFNHHAKAGACDDKVGLTFVYSHQCPFMEEYVGLLADIALQLKYRCRTVKLRSSADARKLGSPFGTLGIFYNGQFLTHELMAERKFRQFLSEKCA